MGHIIPDDVASSPSPGDRPGRPTLTLTYGLVAELHNQVSAIGVRIDFLIEQAKETARTEASQELRIRAMENTLAAILAADKVRQESHKESTQDSRWLIGALTGGAALLVSAVTLYAKLTGTG